MKTIVNTLLGTLFVCALSAVAPAASLAGEHSCGKEECKCSDCACEKKCDCEKCDHKGKNSDGHSCGGNAKEAPKADKK